jgi:AcrR family transcriptional regulator
VSVTRAQPPRRTQAERSAATRARIIAAAIETAVERGFTGTNLQEIARRADVTVGAIQHQFGDKAGVLTAVIEHSLDRLVEDLASSPVAGAELDERVASFMAAVWEGYGGPVYGAAIEIVLGMRTDPEFASRSAETMAGVIDRIDELWMLWFADVEIEAEAHLAAQRLTFDTLNGLALERLLMPGLPFESVVLDSLATAVLLLLTSEEPIPKDR